MPPSYRVTEAAIDARRTAVVAATTTWPEFPTLWRQLLDEVWDCLRAGGVHRGCPNVMLYLDDVPQVEIGVLLDRPCPLTGRVQASALPAGDVASTVHRGSYAGLGGAHEAVRHWCRARARPLAGPRWEIYGPHNDDVAQVWTEVHYLLSGNR
jgi:effector-binding domain-containing protein